MNILSTEFLAEIQACANCEIASSKHPPSINHLLVMLNNLAQNLIDEQILVKEFDARKQRMPRSGHRYYADTAINPDENYFNE